MADNKKAKDTAKKAGKKSNNKKSGKTNPFKSIAAFFKSVRSEGKKVVWPKPLEVLRNSAVVLVVILIVGLIIFGFDRGLSEGFKALKNYAAERKASVSEETTAPTSDDALADLVDSTQDTAEGEGAENADEDTAAEDAAAETDAAD